MTVCIGIHATKVLQKTFLPFDMSAQKPASSGIQTFADGQAFIPSSKRADGSTRKEIKIRPGYKPPEDIEKYKSRTAETWRNRGTGSVPGAEEASITRGETEAKSKNAKRREAARKKKEIDDLEPTEIVETGVANLSVQDAVDQNIPNSESTGTVQGDHESIERQKKIRNQLKKLKAIRDLKSKRTAGEKLSADQLIKISKEQEIVRDLVKLEYNGPEIKDAALMPESDVPD